MDDYSTIYIYGHFSPICITDKDRDEMDSQIVREYGGGTGLTDQLKDLQTHI